ncbi:MAG TPA: ABC transporter permease, partial [Streptomyces sp.]|nr:ABC transporter permease [Streptomyces sp.]
MTAPLPDTTAKTDAVATVDAATDVTTKSVEGRSLRQIAWNRLKRDKLALTGGVIVVFLVLVAIFAPLIVDVFGHPPEQFHQDEIDPLFGTP